MKQRKRHSAEQVVTKLRQAEAALAQGKTIREVCGPLEISEQTFHRWRHKYGSMGKSEVKRLRELEKENVRLKRLVADLTLDKAILKEVIEGKY